MLIRRALTWSLDRLERLGDRLDARPQALWVHTLARVVVRSVMGMLGVPAWLTRWAANASCRALPSDEAVRAVGRELAHLLAEAYDAVGWNGLAHRVRWKNDLISSVL